MPDTAAVVLHWYHGALAIGGLIGLYASIHRIWIAPIQHWRRDVERRLAEQDTQQALAAARLASGDTKFDDVIRAISDLRTELKADHRCLEDRMRRIEQAIAGSVWQGVGRET